MVYRYIDKKMDKIKFTYYYIIIHSVFSVRFRMSSSVIIILTCAGTLLIAWIACFAYRIRKTPSFNKTFIWLSHLIDDISFFFQATKAVLQTHSKIRSPRAAASTSHVIARTRQKYVAYKLYPKNPKNGSDHQSFFGETFI